MTGSTQPPSGNSHSRRAKARDLAARREAAKAKARQRIATSVVAGVVVIVVVVVVAITRTGSSAANKTAAGGAPGAAGSPAATQPADDAALGLAGSGSASCDYTVTGNAAKDVGTPPAKGVAAGSYAATLTTNQGVVTLALDGAKAPCTVNSFIYLAAKGYFADTPCHRLTTAGIFVLQCGDPTGTGSGGPGYQFADENLSGATYPAGTVAMANAGPGTNGSQFFLVYQDTQLPPSYTPFGTVTNGLDALKAIAAKGSDNSFGQGDGHPNSPVTITSVTVTGP